MIDRQPIPNTSVLHAVDFRWLRLQGLCFFLAAEQVALNCLNFQGLCYRSGWNRMLASHALALPEVVRRNRQHTRRSGRRCPFCKRTWSCLGYFWSGYLGISAPWGPIQTPFSRTRDMRSRKPSVVRDVAHRGGSAFLGRGAQ